MGISHEPALGQSPGNINPGIFLQSDSGYTMTVAERCLSHAHSHNINLLIIEKKRVILFTFTHFTHRREIIRAIGEEMRTKTGLL